jgi:hypothetical protein
MGDNKKMSIEIAAIIDKIRIERGLSPLNEPPLTGEKADFHLTNNVEPGSALKVDTKISPLLDPLPAAEFKYRERCLRSTPWLAERARLKAQGAQLHEIEAQFEIFWKKSYEDLPKPY